jgi:hypothetical protein
MTAPYPADRAAVLAALWDSPADWISPPGDPRAPPANAGAKVVLWDTDHLCGLCGSPEAVWSAFARGLNPVFMDPFDSTAPGMDIHLGPEYRADSPSWQGIRRAIGQTRVLAARLDRAATRPMPDMATTGFCLADLSGDSPSYLVLQPYRGSFVVNLSAGKAPLRADWLQIHTGLRYPGARVDAGSARGLVAPFRGEAVVLLRREHRP